MLDDTISYTVTETDTADHFIQMQVLDSAPVGWEIGASVSVDEFKGVVRQVTNQMTPGNYTTNISLGTESIFLDTVVGGGHQFASQDIKGAVQEIFDILRINARIKTAPGRSFPLQNSSQAIQGNTEVKSWLRGLTRLKNSQIINAYFDLYGNFCLYPLDYIAGTIKLSDYNTFINSINIDSTLLHSKPEAISRTNPNAPAEPVEPTADVYSTKTGEIKIGQFKHPPRVTAPETDSKQYIDPIFWGRSLNITLSGNRNIPLHSTIEIDSREYQAIKGSYSVRRRIVNKTPNSTTTEIYCSTPSSDRAEIIRKQNG